MKRIALVHDEPNVIIVLRRELEHHGFLTTITNVRAFIRKPVSISTRSAR